MTGRMFRVHWGGLSRGDAQAWRNLGCPQEVPWELLASHEKQALQNHGGQTLERLHERGGLSPKEMVAVIEDKLWRQLEDMTELQAIAKLVEYLLAESL